MNISDGLHLFIRHELNFFLGLKNYKCEDRDILVIYLMHLHAKENLPVNLSALMNRGVSLDFINGWAITKKSKLFLKYLLSYVLIMIISLSISMIAYYFSVQVIENEIAKAHTNSLNQVKTVSDNLIKELEKLYIQIAFDQRLQMLMGLSSEMLPTNLIEFSNLQKDLQRYKVANPLIKEIYIYFRRSQLVLIDSGRYTMDTFYTSVFPYDDRIFQKWIDTDTKQMVIFSTGADKIAETNQAAYIQPLPIGLTSGHPGKLVIILNESMVRQNMEDLRWIPESLMFIINSDDQLFLQDKDLQIPAGLTYASLLERTVIDTDNGLVVSYSPSSFFDWKYVSVIPKVIFFDRAERVKNMIIISLVVFFIIGLWVSWIMAGRQYSPMSQLVKYIQDNVKEPRTKEEDEYKFIQKILSDTVREKEAILENKNRQSEKLKNEFLIQLIRGELDRRAIDELRDIYHLDIDNSMHYAELLITFADDIMVSSDDDPADGKKDGLIDARLIISSALKELLQDKYDLVLMETENHIVCLFHTGKDATVDHLSETIQQDIDKTVQIIKNQFKITFFTSVSNCHEGYEGIKAAFQEAEEAMEYHLLAGSEPVTYFGDLKNNGRKVVNYYFNKDMEHFSQIMKERDLQNARKSIQRIFKSWIFDFSPPAYLVRYRMNEIIRAVVHTMEDLQMSNDDGFPEYMQMVDLLIKSKQPEELQRRICSLLGDFEIYLKKRNAMEPDEHQKVLAYIQEHYQRADLSISSVADNFGMNAPYLSRQFKQKMGIGPLEYLQLLRIEKAKKLLLNTDKSLKEIMDKVGFVNEVSLIRVFKKYEGTTPGIYRKKLQQ